MVCLENNANCVGLIEPPPVSWQGLQERVGAILSECGMAVNIEKNFHTVRGSVNIDVYAEDMEQSPPAIYLCECKKWQKSVPKSVVHGLRTIVADTGANWGMVITSGKFQSGAYLAAQSSNLHLKSWAGFQEVFKARWWQNFAIPTLKAAVDPVYRYRESLSSQDIWLASLRLPDDDFKEYHRLIDKHAPVIDYAYLLTTHFPMFKLAMPELPLRLPIELPFDGGDAPPLNNMPAIILKQAHLRELVRVLCILLTEATVAFEAVFDSHCDKLQTTKLQCPTSV